MYNGMTFQQLASAERFPNGSIIPVDMGDGSGVKKVTKELLEEEIGKDIIGNMEDLATEDKTSIVAAINEVAESGGGGGSVDVLDTKEEIEANTDPGKAAGALGVKEMVDAVHNKLMGFEPVIDETGKITGYKTSVGGADTVFPFKNGVALLENGSIDISPGDQTYNISLSKTYKGKKMLVDNSYSGYAAAVTETYPLLNSVKKTLDSEFNGWRFRTNCNIKNTIRWYLVEGFD
ncbi:MAG: hypothetical protein HDR71_12355 [Lachnospiraceae bacterium]|nr:hypothetical protein [Lachnospiraceae bacterium]